MEATSVSPSSGLRSLRWLFPYLYKYKRAVGFGLMFVTVSNVCSTTVPRFIGQAIDTIRSNSSGGDVDVVPALIVVLTLTLGSGLFMFLTRRTIIVSSRFIEEDIRNDFTDSLSRQTVRFFNERPTGSFIALFTNDIGAIREFIGPAIMYAANTVTTFSFALFWLFYISIPLTLTVLIPLPFVAIATYRIGRRIHERYRSVQEEYENVSSHAQETFSGIRVVRAFFREAAENAIFRQISNSYYGRNMILARVQALMMPAMMVLFNLSYIAVIGVGGSFVMESTLTVGELTQAFIYLNQLMWPIAAIGWVTNMVQRGAASTARIARIVDSVPAIRDTHDTDHSIKSLIGRVTFTGAGISIENRPILQDINMEIPAGTSFGIVGAIGSGKSILINLIPRLTDTTSGCVMIDRHNVRTIPLDVLRKHITLVPQDIFLFSDTIRNNILFGNPSADDDDITNAVKQAGFLQDIASLPDGLNTVVGERGVTLSGGQKQRVSIARALISPAPIMILDDALSAIDAETSSGILESILGAGSDRTILVVSHRVDAVMKCNKIAILEDGRITAVGTHSELISSDNFYSAICKRQQIETELNAS